MNTQTNTKTNTTGVGQFSDFQLPKAIETALQDLKFVQPTEIQSQTIPLILESKDLMACAQTGSGKTAAYSIPLLKKLCEEKDSGGLILVPTRELAKQIADVIFDLSKYTRNINMTLLIGGVEMHKQLRSLKRNPRIIVATPGRIADHLRRGTLALSRTNYIVLDEGDRMLDMGFMPQLEEVLEYLPKKRQTLLFSATIPAKVKTLAKKFLSNPENISVGPESQPVETIKQSAIQTTNKQKDNVLLDELNARKGSVIIFARTQIRTDRLARTLRDYGHSVSAIHGGRTQGQRSLAIKGFRDGQFRILVATDIAARGIDVPQIEHVINYDLPRANEDYVHRVGRTARAGASGEAVSLHLPEDQRQWRRLAQIYKIKGVVLNAQKGGSFSKSSNENFDEGYDSFHQKRPKVPNPFERPRRQKTWERRGGFKEKSYGNESSFREDSRGTRKPTFTKPAFTRDRWSEQKRSDSPRGDSARGVDQENRRPDTRYQDRRPKTFERRDEFTPRPRRNGEDFKSRPTSSKDRTPSSDRIKARISGRIDKKNNDFSQRPQYAEKRIQEDGRPNFVESRESKEFRESRPATGEFKKRNNFKKDFKKDFKRNFKKKRPGDSGSFRVKF